MPPDRAGRRDGPLLVFGPRSVTYDFGPGHPLTPLRFGPGIDLLEAVGAHPGLPPEPASDEELGAVHSPGYVRAVRRLAADPDGPSEAGIGRGDTPAFTGMHAASAAIAGGSIRAMDAILAGGVQHAFHPGGGLHHAMPGRGSGFCVYNDVALAVARARATGLRVLYLDFDVHHGDGVEEIHRADPGVLTFSIHEDGQTLFPGSGGIGGDAHGREAGTNVNLPLDAGTGADPWLGAVERLVPELAAAFGPDVVVSQHGCDGHAWDPLAHLRLTTTAMGAAARLADELAHRHAGGRWLATGGGGYDIDRVVPRAWSLVWFAGAHRSAPERLPEGWRDRWWATAAQRGHVPLPERFDDDPEVGSTASWAPDAARRATAATDLVRWLTVPGLVRTAVDAGWWDPRAESQTAATPDATDAPSAADATDATAGIDGRAPTILPAVPPDRWAELVLVDRVAGPVAGVAGHRLVGGALVAADRVIASVAAAGPLVVGLVLSAWNAERSARRLLAVGVAPGWRRRGLGTALLRAHLAEVDRRGEGVPVEALVTMAERDAVEPAPREERATVARTLLERCGFRLAPAGGALGRADPAALLATRPA